MTRHNYTPFADLEGVLLLKDYSSIARQIVPTHNARVTKLYYFTTESPMGLQTIVN